MKRSRVALLLFMATFAGSLLAAGMAGGEAGVAAQPLTGGSDGGGYCEFAYDPIDEEPYGSCNLGNCEFADRDDRTSPATPSSQPWYDDESLDFYDADSIVSPYLPPKVAASQDEPLYGVPAEDELPLGPDSEETAYPDLESESSIDDGSPTGLVIEDPLTRTTYDLGSCTRHCWPELYGDTDPQLDLDAPFEVAERVNPLGELIAGVGRDLDALLGRQRPAAPADFVRRTMTPCEIASVSLGAVIGEGSTGPTSPELEVIAGWGRQLQGWIGQQSWLLQEASAVNTRAQYYLEGLNPPPAPAARITVQWSKVSPAGSAKRFVSDLWAGYRDAAWGFSKGFGQIVGLPGLFAEPVWQAQDATVRTRTSLRTPWRIDL